MIFVRISVAFIILSNLPSACYSSEKDTSSIRQTGKVRVSSLEKILFDQINKDRSKAKVEKVILDKCLCKLAKEHAKDMLRNDFFSHISSSGLGPQARARKAGLKCPIYENIGWRSGPDPAKEMVLHLQKTFMNEPKDKKNHRYILLLDKAKYVGVGVCKQKDQVAIVQIFTVTKPLLD